MKIYFEPVIKKVRKNKKGSKTTTTSTYRTKDKDSSNKNNFSEHGTSRKIRTKSAPQSSTSKTTRDYRPLTTGHTTRSTSDRKPPFPPKTAFVRQGDAKPVREKFTSNASRPLVQNRLTTIPYSAGILTEASKRAQSTQTGQGVKYKTCFSPLLDQSSFELNDHESKRSSKITSTLTRNSYGPSTKVTGSDFESSGKLTSKLTVKDLVPSKSATTGEFGSFGKITGSTKFTVRDFDSRTTPKKADSDDSETGKCDLTPVTRDRSVLHYDKSESDTESSLSLSAKDSSHAESITVYKIKKKTPSLIGAWNNSRAQQSDVKLTRGEVIEQSNRSRSIGDILSSINVYLPNLQTKIDKIEQDYSRLNSFLSVARMKIKNHVPTPETESPGIVAWA